MENKLSEYITSKITTGAQLTIVVNRDGFLAQEDTRQEMMACGVELISGRGLELRIQFELANWHAERVCLVIQQESDIMPDIRENYSLLYFSIYSDVLSRYDEDIIRCGVSYRQAEYLYSHLPAYLQNAMQTRLAIAEAEAIYGQDLSKQKHTLEQIPLDWKNPETIQNISEILCEAFRTDSFEQIAHEIAVINYNFQSYLDKEYGALKSSSYVGRPKLVSKILPHIAYKHEKNDKVALIVVDGMSYWQYILLRQELKLFSLNPKDNFTFSWLPSITQLSRQAIFRGNNPLEVYTQNHDSESRLWMEFWQSGNRQNKKILRSDINYYWGGFPILDMQPLRLAYVNNELDDFMHTCKHYGDLHSLTTNWSKRIAKVLADLHEKGYTIYITSDHGSICALPWRSLKQEEKNTLLRTSRGARHLIYEKPEYLKMFLEKNQDIQPTLRTSERFAVWKNDMCFQNESVITHGGSHFMEVIVPFIEIEP